MNSLKNWPEFEFPNYVYKITLAQCMANHNFRLDICPSFALVDQLKFQAEQAYYPMLILQDNSLWWVKLDLVLTSSAALVALKTQACMVVFGSTKLLWLHQKFSRFKKDRNGKK